jgi:hypothetical protein
MKFEAIVESLGGKRVAGCTPIIGYKIANWSLSQIAERIGSEPEITILPDGAGVGLIFVIDEGSLLIAGRVDKDNQFVDASMILQQK